MNTDKIEAAAKKATKGPWNIGPETMAGHVWIYASNFPLMEPVEWRGWIQRKAKELKVRILGTMRCDGVMRRSMAGESESDYKQRCEQECRYNAEFIALTDPDTILELIAEIKAKDELLFAYESVNAPVNPLLAEIKLQTTLAGGWEVDATARRKEIADLRTEIDTLKGLNDED